MLPEVLWKTLELAFSLVFQLTRIVDVPTRAMTLVITGEVVSMARDCVLKEDSFEVVAFEDPSATRITK